MELLKRWARPLTALALLALTLGSPCPPRRLPEPEPDVIIPETTKVLEEDSLSALVSVGADGTLTFLEGTPLVDGLVPGDVIVAGVSEKTPEGLLRKVENASASGGQVIVQTSQARLQDAVTKGQLTVSANLTPADVASSEPLQKGVSRLQQATEDEGIVLALNNVELYSDDNALVTVSGTLSITPSFDLDIELGATIIETLTFNFSAGGGVTLELEATGQASYTREIPLTTLRFLPITFTIGPVPVVLVPTVTLYVGASGTSSAHMTAGVSQTADLSLTLGYQDGSFDAVPNTSSSFDFDIPVLKGQASAKAYGGSRFALLVYGAVGPYAEAQGYLQADASLPDPSCLQWQLIGGLEGKIGIDFLLDEYETRIVDEKQLLADSGGCQSPQGPQGPALASWARTYGGGEARGQAHTIRATADGGYIVIGNENPTVFGGPPRIIKLDVNGNVEWQKEYEVRPLPDGTSGGVEVGPGVDVWPDGDDGYIVSTEGAGIGAASVASILKLNRLGNVVWVKNYSNGERGIGIHSLWPVAGGGYVVTGPLRGSVGAWVARLDGSGNVLWSKHYRGIAQDERSDVVRATLDGGFLVAGSLYDRFEGDFGIRNHLWMLRLNGDGGIQWQRRYSLGELGFNLTLLADGGCYVVGAAGRAFAARLDAAGNVVWGVTCTGGSSSEATGVFATDDGVVVGGTVKGTRDIFDESEAWLFKLSSAGNLIWSKAYGTDGVEGVGRLRESPFLSPARGHRQAGDPLQPTGDGGMIFAGRGKAFEPSDETQFWVVKLTQLGEIDFNASSGARVENLISQALPADPKAADTAATVADLPLTVADVTSRVRAVATNFQYVQQAP